jgi:hypothetical protein
MAATAGSVMRSIRRKLANGVDRRPSATPVNRFTQWRLDPRATARLAAMGPAAKQRAICEHIHRRPLWATARIYGITLNELRGILDWEDPNAGGPHSLRLNQWSAQHLTDALWLHARKRALADVDELVAKYG